MISLTHGACDCHVHVFGDPATAAMDPARAYTPPSADVGALRAHMARVGVERCVLVQPSVYGTDNTIMIEALGELGEAARGICVVPEDIDAGKLAELHAAGVRGIRINLESGGGHDREAIERALSGWAGKIGPLGWHVQLYASFEAIVSARTTLRACELPVVIDHFAMMPLHGEADARRSVDFLAGLLADGPVYLKCSGFYRVPGATPPVLASVVHGLCEAAPSRLVWASDWPHTARKAGASPWEVSPFRQIGADSIVEHLDAWLPTQAMRDAILVKNPAQLYGFGA